MKFLINFVTIVFILSTNVYAFELGSSEIKNGSLLANKHVFNSFGCSGENISPQLQWKKPPKGTKSFALTVYDPDAPTGSGWWHWTVFNIPNDVLKLDAGAGNKSGVLPKGSIQGRTDFGKTGYGGACPPVGDKPHKYIFTVYALKTDHIDLNEEASGALLGFYLHQNVIEKANLIVTYGRN